MVHNQAVLDDFSNCLLFVIGMTFNELMSKISGVILKEVRQKRRAFKTRFVVFNRSRMRTCFCAAVAAENHDHASLAFQSLVVIQCRLTIYLLSQT